MAGRAWLDSIPGIIKLEVHHKPSPPLAVMQKPILGAVLHTTNPGHFINGAFVKGKLLTLDEAKNDFSASGPPPASLFRSAHFMVDPFGNIAQFRSLDQGAAHIGAPWMPRYIGIEHTAHFLDPLTDPQMDASANLLSMVGSELGFPLSELSKAGFSGIGRHQQFNNTGCGQGPFFDNGTFGPDFKKILKRALERSPVGAWEVHVGDWTWIYTFKAGADFTSGSVEWRSLDGSQNGSGTWKIIANLQINWSNGSVEEWNKPLNSSGQSGKLVRQDWDDKVLRDLERIDKGKADKARIISAHRID